MLKFILKYYLPINLLYDVFTSTLWQSGASSAAIRGIFLAIIILISWITGPKNKIYLPFLLYTLFILIMLPFTSHLIESIRLSSKALFTIWAFPIFFVHHNLYSEKIIIRNIFLLSIILIGNYIVSTVFGLGYSPYTVSSDFLVGSLSDSWLIYTFTLFTFIIILKTNNIRSSQKLLFLLIFTLLVAQLLLGLKRTAILSFFFGILIFLLMEKLSPRVLLTYIIGLIGIVLLLNQYADVLSERIYARGDRLQGSYSEIIETEARYLESMYVWKEILSFHDIPKSLFGLEAFNSRGNYGNSWIFGDRFLHVDYNIIVNTTGLFGLFFYFYLFYYIFLKYMERRKFLDYKYREIFLVIFFAQFIASIGGQMMSVTYGSIKFLFMAIALNKYK